MRHPCLIDAGARPGADGTMSDYAIIEYEDDSETESIVERRNTRDDAVVRARELSKDKHTAVSHDYGPGQGPRVVWDSIRDRPRVGLIVRLKNGAIDIDGGGTWDDALNDDATDGRKDLEARIIGRWRGKPATWDDVDALAAELRAAVSDRAWRWNRRLDWSVVQGVPGTL